MSRKRQNGSVIGIQRIYYDAVMNTGTHDLQTVYDSFSGAPTNREGYNLGIGTAIFSGMTFTNVGQESRNGPTQATANSWYTSSVYSTQYASLINFSVTNGYQSFDIPAGTYTVTVDGACGGSMSNSPITGWNHFQGPSYKHARGARCSFTLAVTSNMTLTMVVGSKGANSTTTLLNPGGGGGSFLVKGTYDEVVSANNTNLGSVELIAAAGGGGGYNGPAGGSNNYTAGEGQSTQTNTSTNSGANGSAGNGAAAATNLNNSGGGAGFLTNVAGGTTNGFGTTANGINSCYGFLCGAVGGAHNLTSSSHHGGFGGGGAGSAQTSVDEDKGGGGGYSGGGYGFDAYNFANGGGSIIQSSGTDWSTSGASITRGGGQQINVIIVFA